MANETDGEKGKTDVKGLDQGQRIERVIVAPDGTITIPQNEANLKSVDVADVDLLLSFSDDTFLIIPNGALDAMSAPPQPVVFNDHQSTLGDLFKMVGISNHAKAGSLRVVSGNVDAQKPPEEINEPKNQENEQRTSNDVWLSDTITAPAPMVKIGKGPGLGTSGASDQLVDSPDPVAPVVTPRPSVYRPGHKTESPSDPTITLDANITADNIINIAESQGNVAITGTVGGSAKAGDTVTLTVNGVTSTGLVQAGNTFSINVAGSDLVADPDHTIDASISTTPTETATDTHGYGVDTTAPAAPGVALTSDTGTSGSDLITKVGTLTLTGIDSGATVEYSIDGGKNWTSSFTTVEGSNTVQVHQTDVAGNTSSVGSLAFTLDTTAPLAPTVTLATDSSDGAAGHNNDLRTNNAILTISAAAEPVIREYSIDGGSWNKTYVVPTADGSHTVAVRDTDVAGNTATGSLTFTLDTTAVVSTIVLATDSSDGAVGHNIDLRTNDAALSVSAAAEPVTREYSIDGGSWNTTYTAPSVDGNHTVAVRDTDVAGNTATGNLSFTLDTTAPLAPAVALATDSSDGAIGHDIDLITNNATLSIGATAEPVTHEYSIDGGSWSSTYTGPGVDGSHTVAVRDTDVAGNVSGSTTLSFTLDTIAPTAPIVSLFSDTGVSASDHITNSGALSLSGIETDTTVEY